MEIRTDLTAREILDYYMQTGILFIDNIFRPAISLIDIRTWYYTQPKLLLEKNPQRSEFFINGEKYYLDWEEYIKKLNFMNKIPRERFDEFVMTGQTTIKHD